MTRAIPLVVLLVGLSATAIANDKLSVAEWKALMGRAQVWQPIDTASLDLLQGPQAADALAFDARVTCAYDYPDSPLGGVTPKFKCALTPGDVVKVKYGENNGEVFAEVAGSRLFWALGFFADRMYPVRVTCINCPEDPHRESAREWHLGKSGTVSTRVFDPAAIERPFAGTEVEGPEGDGWSWEELSLVRAAPTAHVDALKLLAAFVQHVDSKRAQQAVICPDGSARGCRTPRLVVTDLGSTFGGARKFNYDKMKLDSWRDVPIWKNPATCEANLTKSFVGTVEHPVISESGRKFLAERLTRLSDRQLRDLFVAARVERRGDTTTDDRGGTRAVAVEDWVRAFQDKRRQIVEHRCPA